MKQITIVAALVAALIIVGAAHAAPGPAPPGTAIAEYNWQTGEIIVSVDNVVNWYIESDSGSLSGARPDSLPAGGGIVSDNDFVIGETTAFFPMTYTDLDLGIVAAVGLPEGDLTITWNEGLGVPTQSQPLLIDPPINYPPTAVFSRPFAIDIGDGPLNIVLDASMSSDDDLNEPISFRWDLDNDGRFEFDTGLVPTFEIDDVTTTFDGIGTYSVAVEVFDGEFWDVASTQVVLLDYPPSTALVAAEYNPATGEIVVSVDGVNNWYIESASSSLTGDDPVGLPAGGGFDSDNDSVVGETSFALFSYSDVNLGSIAQPGLPAGDLSFYWNEGVGTPVRSQPVEYVSNPEPTSLALATLGCALFATRRQKRIATAPLEQRSTSVA